MKRWLSIVGLLSLLALALSLPASTQEQVLVIGTTDRITELSPANSYDYWTWHTLQQTSGALVTLKPGTTEIVPWLAESWTVSADGTTYTFKLRSNPAPTFSDGTVLDCKSMAWSLGRNLYLNGPEGGVGLIGMIKELACPPAKLEVEIGEKPTPEELAAFLEADVDDPYTLVIRIAEPDATFLARLADPIAPSMAFSPKSTPADEFAKGRFAGVGPYQLVSYTPEVEAVYEPCPNNWKEWACDLLPWPWSKLCQASFIPLPNVIVKFYADAAALRLAVERGEVDVGFRTFLPADILDLEARAEELGLQVIKGETSLSVRYIVFNVTAEPFDSVLVRRAISYAVDRERIVQDVHFGLNAPLYSMVPPGLWSHIDAFPKRDVEQAKALLQEAGYSEDNPLEITLWYTPLHYGTEEADVATILKDSLEETGMIRVELQSLEWGAYVRAMSAGEFGMFLLGWYPDFIDPDNFLAPWLVEAPKGLGTWLDEAKTDYDKEVYQKFVDLLGRAKRTTDIGERTALYEEAQRLLAESVVLLPLWSNNSQHLAIAKKNVKGIVLDASMNFRTWLIDKEE